MADFSNFELGDNVYSLANGLLPEMAEVFEVPVGFVPLGELVRAIGTKKTLRENESGAKAWLTQVTGSEQSALMYAADLMYRSGVQKPLDRSLWTPEVATPGSTEIVVTGAVANWQDRTADLLASREPTLIWYGAGNRLMDTATEVVNPNVREFQEATGKLPTEAEYANEVIAPRLRAAGHDVEVNGYATQNGDEIASRLMDFVASNETLAVARVANAGIQLAVQVRNALRARQPAFDANRNKPQMFVVTDTFPIADTLEKAKPENAKDYQNPFTGIRQIALTGKLLVEATAGS